MDIENVLICGVIFSLTICAVILFSWIRQVDEVLDELEKHRNAGFPHPDDKVEDRRKNRGKRI